MKRFLKTTTILGILFVSILGTLAHFFYEWSGNNPIVGLFVPINESTWENMKLLFFPMIIYLLLVNWYLHFHNIPVSTSQINAGYMTGILYGLLAIPTLFYTYRGILGFHLTFIGIAIFYISVILSHVIYGYIAGKQKGFPKENPPLFLIIIYSNVLCVYDLCPTAGDISKLTIPRQ